MISIVSEDAFGDFSFVAFSAKNIPSSSCSCYDQPIFDTIANVFFQSKLFIYLQGFFYRYV